MVRPLWLGLPWNENFVIGFAIRRGTTMVSILLDGCLLLLLE